MKFDLAFLSQHEHSSQANNNTKDIPQTTSTHSSSSLTRQASKHQSHVPATTMTGATLLEVALPRTESVPVPPPPTSSMDVSSSSPVMRSASIPLPSSHIDRTQSELQLCVDEAAAEQREISMFYRVVNGIRERQQTLAAAHPYPHQHQEQTRPTPSHFYSRPYPMADETESSYHTAMPLHAVDDTINGQEDAMDSSWSITGYSEETTGASSATMIPQEEVSSPMHEDIEETGIFELDL